jgi:hypothetical protein
MISSNDRLINYDLDTYFKLVGNLPDVFDPLDFLPSKTKCSSFKDLDIIFSIISQFEQCRTLEWFNLYIEKYIEIGPSNDDIRRNTKDILQFSEFNNYQCSKCLLDIEYNQEILSYNIQNYSVCQTDEWFVKFAKFTTNPWRIINVYNSVPQFKNFITLDVIKKYNKSLYFISSLLCSDLYSEELEEYYFNSHPPLNDSLIDLISYNNKFQSERWINYFKSLNPQSEHISIIICNSKFFRTDEWINYFKSLPSTNKIIKKLVQLFKSDEWFQYYLQYNPTVMDVIDVCYWTSYAPDYIFEYIKSHKHTNCMIEKFMKLHNNYYLKDVTDYFLSKNPTKSSIVRLLKSLNCLRCKDFIDKIFDLKLLDGKYILAVENILKGRKRKKITDLYFYFIEKFKDQLIIAKLLN